MDNDWVDNDYCKPCLWLIQWSRFIVCNVIVLCVSNNIYCLYIMCILRVYYEYIMSILWVYYVVESGYDWRMQWSEDVECIITSYTCVYLYGFTTHRVTNTVLFTVMLNISDRLTGYYSQWTMYNTTIHRVLYYT